MFASRVVLFMLTCYVRAQSMQSNLALSSSGRASSSRAFSGNTTSSSTELSSKQSSSSLRVSASSSALVSSSRLASTRSFSSTRGSTYQSSSNTSIAQAYGYAQNAAVETSSGQNQPGFATGSTIATAQQVVVTPTTTSSNKRPVFGTNSAISTSTQSTTGSSSTSSSTKRVGFDTNVASPSSSSQTGRPVVNTSPTTSSSIRTTSSTSANRPVFGTMSSSASNTASTTTSNSSSAGSPSTTSTSAPRPVFGTGSSSLPSSSSTQSSSTSKLTSTTSSTDSSSSLTTTTTTSSSSSVSPSSTLYSNPRCLKDSTSARTLTGASYGGSGSNTPRACALFCLQQGYSIAGTEYSSECYCGNSLTANVTSTGCTYTCTGDRTQICGGDGAISVVDINPNYVTVDPNAAAGYLGCYDDSANTRALQNASFSSATMTNAICGKYCSSIGLQYAATEYGGNCYCGATIAPNQRLATACYTNCYGNSTEQCGGNGVMSLYKVVANLTFAVPNTGAGKTTTSANDVFALLSSDLPPSIFPQRPHDIIPLSIPSGKPIHTNKQYAQAFIGSQDQALFMVPYGIQYSSKSFVVQHSDIGQYVLSGQTSDGRPITYGGPLNQFQIVFTAPELQADNVTMLADSSLHASVNLKMYPQSLPSASLTMPLVSGMGLVTVRYNGLTPQIQSPVVHISSYAAVTAPNHSGISQKLRLQLGDSSVWVVYIIPDAGQANLIFTKNGDSLTANAQWNGVIQTAKLTTVSDPVQGEATLDTAAGTWVTSMKLAGSTSGSTGTYSLNYVVTGDTSRPPLVFALPHHMEVLVNGGATGLQMQSPITGVATGFLTYALTMKDNNLPIDIGFYATNSQANWNTNTLTMIKKAITPDIVGNNYTTGCNGYSTYFSGKCLAKVAQLCMVAKDIVQDSALTANCVSQLEAVMNIYASNQQKAPLDYETTWKGIVVDAGFQTPGYDFGATDYNDHHFHYGYLVYAAAVMGYLDSSWLTNDHIAWVNTLIRDVSSPSENDPYFPQFRSMDWYVGHSVAHGIVSQQNVGKDQESSSEDYNYSYGLKLWGHVIGNANLEGLGNLMCAINTRSVNNYLLLGPGNKNFPESFNKNYASGVTFGNTVGYFTFFGGQTQYVNGIHMLPMTAISPYMRKSAFVQSEWNNLLGPLLPSILNSGWAGILSSDLAISDAQTSWNFFANGSVVNFNYYNLDDGQTLTWALAFAAGLGGGQ